MKNFIKFLLFLLITLPMLSQEKNNIPKSNVDFDAFIELSEEIKTYRKSHLVTLDTFISYLEDENTVLLDTRSEAAYMRKHIKGAIHINFSDFTKKKLSEKIASKNTRILIYCNNNIAGDPINFASKKVELVLNIPTFVNLYRYGYKNVYELSSLVSAEDKRLSFEGSDVDHLSR